MKRIATTLLVAGLMATPMLALPPPAAAAVSIGVSIGIAPPTLPVYAQPIAPGAGYIWTPGYWAWDAGWSGYYWVPGTWVMPPRIGLLWTPGWWGWSAGYYRWNHGYWGTRVGFYGGINYGFGYFGTGYVGGYWRGRDFFYNRAVNNVNVTNIRNVYVNKTVINNVNVNRVSYNGGRGGITAQPDAAQRTVSNERRWAATSMQTRQRDVAMRNPAQRFTHEARPAVFATQRAGNNNPPHSRMVAAPDRARPMMATEHGSGMVEAPRERMQPNQPMREQRTMQERERPQAMARERRNEAAHGKAEQVRDARHAAPRDKREHDRRQ